MKKLLLYTLFSVLITANSFSQAVISLSDLTPTIGSTITQASSDFTETGSSGANQTWDFSDLTSNVTQSTQMVDPITQPNGSEFPDATVAGVVVGADQTGYQRYADNKAEAVGIAANGTLMYYTNHRTQFEFPLSYQSTFTDTYLRTADLGSGISNDENGTISSEVDGYGTLTTPSGTFTDVLRVKETSEGTIDAIMNGNTISSTPFNGTSYYYVKAGYPAPLLAIVNFEPGGQTLNNVVYYVSGATKVDELPSLSNLTVYPSPAVDYINVNFDLEKTTEITFNLIGIDGRLAANLDKSTWPSGENNIRLDLPQLATGLYLLQFSTPDGQTTQRIVIQ